MKLALTVLHGNITDSNSNIVGNAEAIGIAKLISKNYDIDILTCKECAECIHVDENYDINKYDKLFIVNGSLNMFGGLEIDTATTIYKLLHKYNKQIYYILTDLSLPFIDYWEHISNKPWASKYNKDDFKLNNGITILSQFSNIDYVQKLHKDITINDFKYIPWALWQIELGIIQPANMLMFKMTDLIYGGSFRSGKRENKMLDYFFNKSISVELYGSIKLSQFNKEKYTKAPIFTGKVSIQDVINKNSEGLATIIIGDNNYNNNTITLRVYESLLSDAIVFIDEDFDSAHKILNDDWLYVKSGKELEQKIKLLKEDFQLYQKYKQNQKAIVNDIIAKKQLSKEIDLLVKEN